jgi:gliding motility-associated-like protein
MATQFPDAVAELIVTPGGSTPQLNNFSNSPPVGLDAIGFRKTDNLLYGISRTNNHLFRIGANGAMTDLGALPLDNALYYFAGDVSPNGQYLFSIGSQPNGKDIHLARTDLTDPDFITTTLPLTGTSKIVDIAFDPYTNTLYGYDRENRQVLTINTFNGNVTPLGQIGSTNEIAALYFDAFGDLYAYGRAVFGTVAGFFSINKNTGSERLLATGPIYEAIDAASCPFSVELKNDVEPEVTLPCTELTFTYTMANGSGESFSGLDFEHPLPPGFHLSAVLQNSLGVPVDTLSQPGAIRLNNFTLTPGIKNLVFKISVNDIVKGQYKSQAFLKKLPDLFGLKSSSDDPATGGFEDSTGVAITRVEEDTLSELLFICQGESVVLDATAFGSNIIWNTGATGPLLEVSQGGLYSVEVETGCQTLLSSYDVTSASCPFTISLAHEFVPDTVFPCSDLIFRYIFDNDSGEERKQVSFLDTLPAGFSFLEILNGPTGAILKPSLPPDIVCLENLTLPKGKDTLDLLVKVGDVLPGDQFNRAMIYNLPQVLGPTRLSDYLLTLPADASRLYVLGTWSDTLYFDTVVCANAELILDARHLGKNFLWQDGSTSPVFIVKEPGAYHLTLFDGCKPAQVFWTISAGTPVEIVMPHADSIHLGEQLEINPMILNAGDSLGLAWTDPVGNSLSCTDCLHPVTSPFESVTYTLIANNGVCADTATIALFVDINRRIYAPNAFSPNDDGINDFFFLQSPDFGFIHHLDVFDRWGGLVFTSNVAVLNDEKSGWDGMAKGQLAMPGVYTWRAEIEFIDGKKSVFHGAVLVVR